MPDGRYFEAVNWCKFGLLELSELSKGECDGNRCQHPCFSGARAATEHHKGLRKGPSGAFRCHWEGIFLIWKGNLCSDQPDLLSLVLLSLQLLPWWHKPCCSNGAILVLPYRRASLHSLHQSDNPAGLLWGNVFFHKIKGEPQQSLLLSVTPDVIFNT